MLLPAPKLIALDFNGYAGLTQFLANLRSRAANGVATCLDFRPTTKLVAGGVLLMYAEIDRLRTIYPELPLTCRPPKTTAAVEAFEHLGVFAMLGYKSGVTPSRPDVISWRTASASSFDETKVGDLITSYKPIVGKKVSEVFRGVGEAVTNAMHHAYEGGRQDGLKAFGEKRWWMFCRVEANFFYAAVCDLGIGIPRSVPTNYAEAALVVARSALKYGNINTDASLIRIAMQLARTRTRVAGRGLGLGDLKRIVNDVPGTKLHLMSNRGRVTYSDGAYKQKNESRSIFGTIALWAIPLDEKKE